MDVRRSPELAEYNVVPSIAHYALVEQFEPLVHVYSRGASGDFNIRPEQNPRSGRHIRASGNRSCNRYRNADG